MLSISARLGDGSGARLNRLCQALGLCQTFDLSQTEVVKAGIDLCQATPVSRPHLVWWVC